MLIRKSSERGHFNHGWLDTYHTFSFADYHDPRFMGFRSLRVINEDRVEPGMGFPTHSHRDMEIITYILEGELEHKDSMGNAGKIRPGEVQRMSAGRGVTHSEYNPSSKEGVHLLQIWILPDKKSIEPEYEQKKFAESKIKSKLCLVASADGRDGSVLVHQDVRLYVAALGAGQAIEYSLDPGRHAWIQAARGEISVNGQILHAGDGAAVSGERLMRISSQKESEILLFDLN